MHYESNAKSSDRDPRQTFRTPADPSNVTGAGVVGPLGSSSFSLPTVERALVEMEGGGANEKTSEREGRRAGAVRRVSLQLNGCSCPSVPLCTLGSNGSPCAPDFDALLHRDLFYTCTSTRAATGLSRPPEFPGRIRTDTA